MLDTEQHVNTLTLEEINHRRYHIEAPQFEKTCQGRYSAAICYFRSNLFPEVTQVCLMKKLKQISYDYMPFLTPTIPTLEVFYINKKN
jgi:hypothetical protein